MIFDLVQDLAGVLQAMPGAHTRHRAVGLLHEAIRRDVHFIARHPTTLFQCLWNSCWWYDCPQAARHCLPRSREAPRSGLLGWLRRLFYGKPESPPLPWLRCGPKLYELLQEWRTAKEDATPGFPWLRSLRPPRTPLGRGQRAVIQTDSIILQVAYCANGRRLVTAGFDLRIWDAESGAPVRSLKTPEQPQGAIRVASATDGDRLAAGYEGGVVRLWDFRTGVELWRITGVGSVVAVSPDGHRVAGSSHVWDAEGGVERLRIDEEKSVNSLAFSPDGGRLAIGRDDGTIHIRDAVSGKLLQQMTADVESITSVAFSPDGHRLVTTGRYRVISCNLGEPIRRLRGVTAQVWDAYSGRELVRMVGPLKPATAAVFSPDGRLVVTALEDRTVRLWDAKTGAPVHCFLGHDERVLTVAYSPDGREIASGSVDGTIRLWDPEARDEVPFQFGHEESPWGWLFSPDGRWLSSCSYDATLLWEVATGTFVGLHDESEAEVFRRTVLMANEWSQESLESLQELVSRLTTGAWGGGNVPAAVELKSLASWWQEQVTLPGPWHVGYWGRDRERVIRTEAGFNGEEVAWHPEPLIRVTVHPSGRLWVGKHRSYGDLHMFTLEGDASVPESGVSTLSAACQAVLTSDREVTRLHNRGLTPADQEFARTLNARAEAVREIDRAGNALADAGRLAEAIEYYEESIRLREVLSSRPPVDPELSWDLVAAIDGLGITLCWAGQVEEGRRMVRRAGEMIEEMDSLFPAHRTIHLQIRQDIATHLTELEGSGLGLSEPPS